MGMRRVGQDLVTEQQQLFASKMPCVGMSIEVEMHCFRKQKLSTVYLL